MGKAGDSKATIPARPLPPDMQEGSFIPAPDVEQWIRRNYIDPTGPLFTEEHAHLEFAHIGVLWASILNVRQMRRVIGQAECPRPMGNAWTKGRAEYQLTQWFGEVPDFIITLDADYAREADDLAFCALVDHEIFHCSQAMDEYGAPKFTADGKPKFAMRAHDVQEFVSVVRRFGIEAAGDSAVKFVEAAQHKPLFGRADVKLACGACCG